MTKAENERCYMTIFAIHLTLLRWPVQRVPGSPDMKLDWKKQESHIKFRPESTKTTCMQVQESRDVKHW
jgi:hypothetical protein